MSEEAQIHRQSRSTATWRILVATDGSPCAVQAQELLARFGFPAGTRIEVIAVAAHPFAAAGIYGDAGFACWQVNQELLEAERQFLTRTVREAMGRLSAARWDVASQVRVGNAGYEILAAAQRLPADLILVGTRGRTGLDRLLLGSTAGTVARSAPCPVLIARALRGGLSRVILAVDGSPLADRAIELVARLPLPQAAEVRVLHVLRPYHPFAERLEALPGGRERFGPRVEAARERQQQLATGLVEAACRRLVSAGKRAHPVTATGDAAHEIAALAEERRADLIVVGARGISPVSGLLLGSVADRLLHHAPCSLLFAR
jgi:nucleotide-binding universal stress UspA family protein